MPSVLILGARAPVALDHARRFARQGWEVHVADSRPCRISGWSDAVRGVFSLPPPRSEPRAFAAALACILNQNRINLLLPTCEEVFYVARYRAMLPSATMIGADHFDKLQALHSKLEFLDIARSCDAGIPDSAAITQLAQAREWARGRAVVLKPEYSRFGAHVRLYPRGIPAKAPELERLGRWVVQEYCAGEELCSYSAAVQGRLTAHVAYRPAYRLSRSSSYYFERVDAAEIRGFVERLVAKIGYTGQISFDWIRCPKGRYTVLECNPRAISGVHLFGQDDPLPAALYGQNPRVVEPRSARPRMIAAVMLSAGLISAIRSGALSRWWRDFRRAGDVLSSPGDRSPIAGCIADFASYATRAWREKCTLHEAATRDIEWDGEALPERELRLSRELPHL